MLIQLCGHLELWLLECLSVQGAAVMGRVLSHNCLCVLCLFLPKARSPVATSGLVIAGGSLISRLTTLDIVWFCV